MDLLVLQGEYRELVLRRWSNGRFASLATFSPYAHYCLRVHTLFLMGMSHGLLGTRNPNVIDIQYLFYMPLVSVFCSGDTFLREMASLVLAPDQSFVWYDHLREALNELASRREAARTAGGDTAAENIDPAERSLVWNLWVTHRGHFVPQAKRQRISPERSAEIMNEIRPIANAMDKAARTRKAADWWPR